MKINVHAGHNPDGMTACGAVGIIKESTAARQVKDMVIARLAALGHEVHDCTVNDGQSQKDVLNRIVQKCNNYMGVDLNVSIHLNAGRNDYKGDGSNGGCECYIYTGAAKSFPAAVKIAENLGVLGFKRRKDGTSPAPGVKVKPSLYVLNASNAPTVLVEICFVDDADDVQLFDPVKCADAIAAGIVGLDALPEPEISAAEQDAAELVPEELYRVQVGAYKNKDNAARMKKQLEKCGFTAYIVRS